VEPIRRFWASGRLLEQYPGGQLTISRVTVEVHHALKLPRNGVLGCMGLLTFSLGRLTANPFLTLNWPDLVFVPAVRRRLAMLRMPKRVSRKAHRPKIKLGLLSVQKISQACPGTPEER